ncbi:MAG: thiamine diphosphokinase [Deltaproteobacteria bacterium]|jgi:thiamine pyrophosphokinase|nr:thiamine diphosphokinase [Deltaproteobacteria bacterium]
MFPRVYVFLNGIFSLPRNFPSSTSMDELVIATDGGIAHLAALGWKADVFLGDFDSAPENLRDMCRRDRTVSTFTFPMEKDKTDFELALEYAIEYLEPRGVIELLGAFGGRWDMTFSNLFLPASVAAREHKDKRPRFLFREGSTLVYLMHGPDRLVIPLETAGSTVSLVPLSPTVRGVTLKGGFKYPLKNGTLPFGITLGMSNEFHGSGGLLTVRRGSLAVFIEIPPEGERREIY